jgi:hypothetical protein
MRNKKKIEYIYIPIYDINIWYFKDWTRPEIQVFLEKKYSFTEFSANRDVNGSVIFLPIWLKNSDEDAKQSIVYCLYLTDPKDLGIVAHEVFHIVSRVLRNKIGIELSDESEEAYAYLITNICDEIVKINNKSSE